MKFENSPHYTNARGIVYVRDDILKAKDVKACMQCGCPTIYVEVCSEGHCCSDECKKAWYEEFQKTVREMESLTENL